MPDDDIPVYEGNYQIDICPGEISEIFEGKIDIQQNAPNPFHRNTDIIVRSKEEGTSIFRVSNMFGEVIHTEQIYLISGENNISFDGSKFPYGVYFYSVGKNGNYTSKKMIIK